MVVDVTVRQAEVGDASALAELNGFVQDFHRAHEPTVFKHPDPAEVAAWFAAELDATRVRIWVAATADGIVGYVSVLVETREEHLFCYLRPWWEVDQISVHPDWRRQGIARALLQAVAAEAEQAGVDRLLLSSWSFNAGAQEAWRHLGFEPQSTRFEVQPRRLAE